MRSIIFIISVLAVINSSIAQENKLFKQSRSTSFGWDISSSGNICCISDPHDSVSDKTNGSVQVYEKIDNSWKFLKTITKNGPKQFEYFGHAISVSNSYIAISAIGNSKKGFMSGSVSVYRLINNDVTFLYELFPLTSQKKAYFGDEVRIINNELYVGATGVNKSGAVFVYELSSGILKQMILPLDVPAKIQFGKSIASNNNFLFVGAPATNIAEQNGTVYVYKLNDNNEWTYSTKLQGDPLNTGSMFGCSISCMGNSLVVGAPHEDIIHNSKTMHYAGSIYLFTYDPINNLWSLRRDIDNPQAESHDLFGEKVLIKDSIIYTATPREDIHGSDQGEVYFIKYPEINDSETKLIKTLHPQMWVENEYFGNNFEVSDNNLFVCVAGNISKNKNPYIYYYMIDTMTNVNNLNSKNNSWFEVYPNPAKNYIEINVNEDKPNVCNLYDSRGTLVKQIKLTMGSAKVDISNNVPGVYILNYTSESLSVKKEIIVLQ